MLYSKSLQLGEEGIVNGKKEKRMEIGFYRCRKEKKKKRIVGKSERKQAQSKAEKGKT